MLDFPTAVLGGKVEVPTVDGRARVTIEPGTQSGKVLRMRGKGIPSDAWRWLWRRAYQRDDLHSGTSVGGGKERNREAARFRQFQAVGKRQIQNFQPVETHL